MKIDVINNENKKVDEIEIDDNFFKLKVKDDLIHDLFLFYQQNNKQCSANTKTRGEVAGGGRKPWRQKGTGRARHGSIRSPIWKGGGVTFGPKPYKKRVKINKNAKKVALQYVLARKIKDNEIKVLDKYLIEQPKTKIVAGILKNIGLYRNCLLYTSPSPRDLSTSRMPSSA